MTPEVTLVRVGGNGPALLRIVALGASGLYVCCAVPGGQRGRYTAEELCSDYGADADDLARVG
jgi:hypothetical protein